MPTAQCVCGKRIGVSDALIGKSVRCPQCGESVFVVASSKPPAKVVKSGGAGIQISGGMYVTMVLLALGFTIVTLYKTGPGKVWAQWDTLGPKASDQVLDVVTFSLQAYLSERFEYIPGKSKKPPGVEGPINFIVPRLVMNMPEKLKFFGMTSQGKFVGEYNTRNGEIEADIAYGGRTVGGLITAEKAEGAFHITGRDPNSSPQAEVDGRSLKIVYPPKDVE